MTHNVAVQDAAPPTDWVFWLSSIAGADARQVDISERTGIDQSTVSRWYSARLMPSAATAVAVARAYAVAPIEALIAAGYLKPSDVELPTVDPRSVPTHILIAELARRTA